MPRKKFEEERYSSVKAVMLRDAAAVGRTEPRGERRGPEAPPEVAPEAQEAAPEPVQKPEARVAAPVVEAPKVVEKPAAAKVVAMPDRASPQSGSRGKLTEGKTKRFRLAVEEQQQVDDCLASIQRRTRQTITLSHVARVACELLVRLEEEVVEELDRHPLPARPSTSDSVAYAMYEEEVLKRLRRVYKKAR